MCRAGLDSVSSCGRLWIPTWSSASRCSGFTFQLCRSHIQLCQAPHPYVGSMPSSASSCAASSCAEHSRILHPAVQDCPGEFWPYEATRLELFWTHVGHSHFKRTPGRGRDNPQLVTDRDSLQGKGRENLGRMGMSHP